ARSFGICQGKYKCTPPPFICRCYHATESTEHHLSVTSEHCGHAKDFVQRKHYLESVE
ncbi:hypothetical protein NDU88_003583, partial [Pleurodeles waltl]